MIRFWIRIHTPNSIRIRIRAHPHVVSLRYKFDHIPVLGLLKRHLDYLHVLIPQLCPIIVIVQYNIVYSGMRVRALLLFCPSPATHTCTLFSQNHSHFLLLPSFTVHFYLYLPTFHCFWLVSILLCELLFHKRSSNVTVSIMCSSLCGVDFLSPNCCRYCTQSTVQYYYSTPQYSLRTVVLYLTIHSITVQHSTVLYSFRVNGMQLYHIWSERGLSPPSHSHTSILFASLLR